MSQKRSLRQIMTSGLANRKLANAYIDALTTAQTQFNAALDKLNAAQGSAIATDFSTLAIKKPFIADAPLSAQNKATPRRSLRSALMNKKVADSVVESLESTHKALNEMLAKLDAQGGTLSDTDFAALTPKAIDADAKVVGAQNKAPAHRIMQVALASNKASAITLNAMVQLNDSITAALAIIDSGEVSGKMENCKVAVLSPDADINSAPIAPPVIPNYVSSVVTAPASGAIVLAANESMILDFTVAGKGFASLEIDHDITGMPEFSVYADEADPTGGKEAEFAALGVSVVYAAGQWTIDLGETVTDAMIAQGTAKIYFAVRDADGEYLFGSMSPTTPENTLTYQVSREEIDEE